MKTFKSDLTGISTVFFDLDYRIDGLQKGKLVLIIGEDEKKRIALVRDITEFVEKRECIPVVYVDEDQNTAVNGIRERILILKPEDRPKLIVVENMEKLICEESKNGAENYNMKAKALKDLAVEFGCPVLAVTDFLSDDIKQHADLILQIRMEESERDEDQENKECKLVITKCPEGSVSAVLLIYQTEHNRFANKLR